MQPALCLRRRLRNILLLAEPIPVALDERLRALRHRDGPVDESQHSVYTLKRNVKMTRNKSTREVKEERKDTHALEIGSVW